MQPAEYAEHDGLGLKGLIDDGQVSSEEVRDAALRALEEVNPRLNALVGEPFDDVSHDPAGPLGGVPFLVKDLVCMIEGKPIEWGSRLTKGFIAPMDSFLMSRFKAAGLRTLGKTATPEMGFNANTAPVANGITRNPWDTDRIPGGSSGGSAALVAARAVPIAHANDGGGSIRIPAACNGLVGLKPTRGRVPLGPAVDEAINGAAVELAVTRSVRDTAAVLDAVCGPAPGEKYFVARPARTYAEELGADPGRLRVALRTQAFWGTETDPEVAGVVQEVARQLESLGHTVEEASPALDVEAFFGAQLTIWSWFNAVSVLMLAELSGREPGPDTLERGTLTALRHGAKLSALELAQAFAAQNTVTRIWGAFLDDFDLLLTPTLPVPALPVGSLDQDAESIEEARDWLDHVFGQIPFTSQLNMSGQPAVSLPLGVSSDGLPIGVQLAAQALREDVLLRVAAQLEEAMPWAHRRPKVRAGATATAT
jgi:amidase